MAGLDREGTLELVLDGVALLRDISAQTRFVDQLHEPEARFRSMANASPALLWMSGSDARRVFFNQTWLQFTGRTLEEEWGMGWAKGIHVDDYHRSLDAYHGALDERREFHAEYRLRRADGEYRWILDKGTPRYSPDGAFVGYVGSCVDVTVYKSIESDLRKTIRDRDDFLSIAAHELKTPLTSLNLQLGSLLKTLKTSAFDGPMAGRAVKGAQTALRQVERLTTLVEELLDMSQVTAGRLQLRVEEVDFSDVVRDVAARLDAGTHGTDARIHVDATAPLRGAWDRGRLERVVTNLLSNAVKFGAGKPVRVSLHEDDGAACLHVRDEGLGIDPGDQKRIFERFERAASAKNYGGFGLGLWIVRELVQAHGGQITVESARGEGATFKVSLPKTGFAALK